MSSSSLRLFQDSSCTELNRYPEIFARTKELVPVGRVLSFGCSTGEEVRSLKKINPEWEVHGVERDPESLREAIAEDPEGTYASDVSLLPCSSYDLVFCMSVLCRWPPVEPEPFFPFEDFEEAIALLDSVVAPGGLLVLWNAQYDFRECAAASAYHAYDLGLTLGIAGFAYENCLLGREAGSGWVQKYDKGGRPLPDPDGVPLAFRKSMFVLLQPPVVFEVTRCERVA